MASLALISFLLIILSWLILRLVDNMIQEGERQLKGVVPVYINEVAQKDGISNNEYLRNDVYDSVCYIKI